MFEKYIPIEANPGSRILVDIHEQDLNKVAEERYTPQSLLDVMDTLKPREDGVYVLLNALSAGEAVGANRNRDFFPEWSLKGEEPPKEVKRLYKQAGHNIPDPKEYGHKTFVTNAHVFHLHDNKDPLKAVGEVVASDYNDKMRRVELVAFLDGTKLAYPVMQVRAGGEVPFSMGSHLPSDACGHCLNLARNRAEYCEHLKTASAEVGSDGRSTYSYNFFPKFFDISVVRTPADSTAWSLRKVAQVGSATAQRKLSERYKGDPEKALHKFAQDLVRKAILRPANRGVVEYIKKHGSASLAHLTAQGIILNSDEAQLLYSTCRHVPSSFDTRDINRSLLAAAGVLAKQASMYDPHFSAWAPKTPHTEAVSAYPEKYAHYLRGIDLEPFTQWVGSEPLVLLAADSLECQEKTASATGKNAWYPFAVAVTSIKNS